MPNLPLFLLFSTIILLVCTAIEKLREYYKYGSSSASPDVSADTVASVVTDLVNKKYPSSLADHVSADTVNAIVTDLVLKRGLKYPSSRNSSTEDASDTVESLKEVFKTLGLKDSNKGIGEKADNVKEDNVKEDSLVREVKPRKILDPHVPNAANCSNYLQTGTCSNGANCRYHHPAREENQEQISASPESGQVIEEKEKEELSEKRGQQECKLQSGGCKFGKARGYNPSWKKPVVPARDFNFLGLPIRSGERECNYYMRTGSCKYGPICRFNHPEPTAVGGDDIPSGSVSLYPSGVSQQTSTSWSSPPNETVPDLDAANPYVPMTLPPQGVHPNLEWNGYQAPAYLSERSMHPPPALDLNNPTNRTDVSMHNQQHLDEFLERHGQPECSYSMKTGDCKYRSSCKSNHLKNRVPKSSAFIVSPMGDAEAKHHQKTHSKYGSARKKPLRVSPLESGQHDHYGSLGNGGGGPSRADEVDNWAVGKKAPATARSMGLGSGFKDTTSDMDCRGRAPPRDGDCDRPPLVLDPPKVNGVVNEPPKVTRRSPFGAGRPREEVLAEKGLNWREMDSVVGSYETTSQPTRSQSSSPLSVQSNSSESPVPQVLGAPPHDGDREHPPLVLDPPKDDGVVNEPSKATMPSPVGATCPKEEVLDEKGCDWRKLNSVIESLQAVIPSGLRHRFEKQHQNHDQR